MECFQLILLFLRELDPPHDRQQLPELLLLINRFQSVEVHVGQNQQEFNRNNKFFELFLPVVTGGGELFQGLLLGCECVFQEWLEIVVLFEELSGGGEDVNQVEDHVVDEMVLFLKEFGDELLVLPFEQGVSDGFNNAHPLIPFP